MSSPTPIFEVQNLTIVIVAKNHNPTVLNPDFLKHNNIVPANWELAGPAFCIDPIAKVSFLSGVNIVAQSDRVSFTEGIAGKTMEAVSIPEIASQYVSTLKHVNYRAVGINPSGFVTVAEDEKATRDFIVKKFFPPSLLGCISPRPESGGVKLSSVSDGWKLTLSADEGVAQAPGKAPAPVVLFEGNFHHDLVGNSIDDRLKQLHDRLKEWPKLVENFSNAVARILSIQ